MLLTYQGRIQTLELGGANGVECECGCADALCASAIQGFWVSSPINFWILHALRLILTQSGQLYPFQS